MDHSEVRDGRERLRNVKGLKEQRECYGSELLKKKGERSEGKKGTVSVKYSGN